jgi:hypothetical protein
MPNAIIENTYTIPTLEPRVPPTTATGHFHPAWQDGDGINSHPLRQKQPIPMPSPVPRPTATGSFSQELRLSLLASSPSFLYLALRFSHT